MPYAASAFVNCNGVTHPLLHDKQTLNAILFGIFFSVVACASSSPSASAADWGTIRGKFVCAGKVSAKKVDVSPDAATCVKEPLVDESTVVGKDGGVANVFVFLIADRVKARRDKKVEIHPDIKPASEPKVLDNIGCRFEPHAMTLWTEQQLEIRNSDVGFGHNTNASGLLTNPKFNEQVTSGSPIIKKFAKSEDYPTKIACNSHAWMNAHILIRDNPYMAVSAVDGSFEIANVPAGKRTFTFWHETNGNLKDVTVGGDKTDRKGHVEIIVPASGILDLGIVEITPAMLQK